MLEKGSLKYAYSAVFGQNRNSKIVISYRDHKTEIFFVPRVQPEVRYFEEVYGGVYKRYFLLFIPMGS